MSSTDFKYPLLSFLYLLDEVPQFLFQKCDSYKCNMNMTLRLGFRWESAEGWKERKELCITNRKKKQTPTSTTLSGSVSIY